MPYITYEQKNFKPESLEIIQMANRIIADYAAQGFDLTLRQLYYQFVSRALIPNTEKSYKRIGNIISDARLAGMVDWNSISDRTRTLRGTPHWENPGSIIKSAAYGYSLDKWAGQEYRCEVWIEKDALVGVIQDVCNDLDLDYFSCRGYTSQSEMWRAAMRLQGYRRRAQKPVIIHLGDHDPSGIDMTRDIEDRMDVFGVAVMVERIALTMNQIEEYDPPPNPAKITDTRAAGYIAEYGHSSWELDALEPSVIAERIRYAVESRYLDQGLFDQVVSQENEEVRGLTKAAENWEKVAEFLERDAG